MRRKCVLKTLVRINFEIILEGHGILYVLRLLYVWQAEILLLFKQFLLSEYCSKHVLRTRVQ